jgi:hypothetical protein
MGACRQRQQGKRAALLESSRPDAKLTDLQVHILLLRSYASQHGKPGSGCPDCSSNTRRTGLRWVWVTWEDFLEHHFFKYQYAFELAGRYHKKAFPPPSDFARRKSDYIHQGVAHGVTRPTGNRPFDESDRSLLKTGFFPYDLDEALVRAAWQDDFGDER